LLQIYTSDYLHQKDIVHWLIYSSGTYIREAFINEVVRYFQMDEAGCSFIIISEIILLGNLVIYTFETLPIYLGFPTLGAIITDIIGDQN
jgi:hypothetical protein